MKAFIFTALITSTSFDRPVFDVIVKRLKFPFRGCISERSVKLNAYKLSEWEFSFICNLTAANLYLQNAIDKGVCNRYTLIQKIIGTSNSRYWGRQWQSFSGGLFLFCFLCLFSYGCFIVFFSFFFC